MRQLTQLLNMRQLDGASLYSDGCLREADIAGHPCKGAGAAGAAVTKGPLHIIARVTRSQQSYRAELVGVAIGTTIACLGDTQCIDINTVTQRATTKPGT